MIMNSLVVHYRSLIVASPTQLYVRVLVQASKPEQSVSIHIEKRKGDHALTAGNPILMHYG